MEKKTEIQFPTRKGSRAQWRLSDAQLATLTRKYGPMKVKRVILPRIQKRLRDMERQEARFRTWLVRLDPKTIYSLRTGRFMKVPVPVGFTEGKRPGQIRVKKGYVLSVKNGKGVLVSARNKGAMKEMKRAVEDLKRKRLKDNPPPAGMSVREFHRMHKLPRPWKVRGHGTYTHLARHWWQKMTRTNQKEFRRLYPEKELRALFPLTSTRQTAAERAAARKR